MIRKIEVPPGPLGDYLASLGEKNAVLLVQTIESYLNDRVYSQSLTNIQSWLNLKHKITISPEFLIELLPLIGIHKDDLLERTDPNNTYWMHARYSYNVIVEYVRDPTSNLIVDVKRQRSNAENSRFCGSCQDRFWYDGHLLSRTTQAVQREMGDHLSMICDLCAEKNHLTRCPVITCRRFDLPSRFRADENRCSWCYRRFLEDTMFLNNEFKIQIPLKPLKKKMRHAGCEIECYVNPKAKMRFNQNHVYSIKRDGSLTSLDKGHPIELVTQPLIDSRDRGMRAICRELKKHEAKVDHTCGGHVHIDASDMKMTRMQNMNLVRHLFRIYEGAFYAVTTPVRMNSEYCFPVSWYNEPIESRYHSLNFQSVQKFNTIEFRSFGGSVDAGKWIDRIELCEGFTQFAKDNLKLLDNVTANNTTVAKQKSHDEHLPLFKKLAAIDSGFQTWDDMIAGYNNETRVRDLRNLIKENGEALITLAGARFGLSPKTIDRLICYHKVLWKKK